MLAQAPARLSVRGQHIIQAADRAGRHYSQPQYCPGDTFLFGGETRGLPPALLQLQPPERHICIPMRRGNRSLNLGNAVAVVVYEAWRQNGFAMPAADAALTATNRTPA